MGKKDKNKYNSSIPQQTARQAPAPAKVDTHKVVAAAANIASLTGGHAPAWDEKQLTSLVDVLDGDSRQRFASIAEELASLGRAARELVETRDAIQAELDRRHAELKDRERMLSEAQAEAERLRAEASKTADQANARRLELIEIEQRVAREEAKVRNGCIDEREAALRELRVEIDTLLDRKKDLLLENERARQSISAERAALQEQALALLEVERKALDARQADLQREATRVKHLAMDVEAKRSADMALLDQEKEHLRSQFLQNEEHLKIKLAIAESRAKRIAEGEARLQQELQQYEELRDVLAGRPPASLVDELDELRRERNALASRVAELSSLSSTRDYERVAHEREDLSARLAEAESRLAAANATLGAHRTLAYERASLEKENALMKGKTTLLDGMIKELQAQIDTLTNQQQQKVPFPECSRMDAPEFQRPVAVEPVPELQQFAEELRHRIAQSEPGNPLYYDASTLRLFIGGLAMSRLHVLQGISGTGKTSLAQAFTKAVGGHCEVIPVQAGWRDKYDLLGHYNAFEKRYYEKDCLQTLYRAQTEAHRDQLHVVLLDEMNLSRPEQYFAEFLSALEQKESSRIITLMESAPANAPSLLIDGRRIRVPNNVWFIGTANHDETTHEFADKTYDRSHVMDLPRHVGTFDIHKFEPTRYSYSSLEEAFRKAWSKHEKACASFLRFVSHSEFTQVLENTYGLGWGNRFERQAHHFLPVVKECGGTFEEGLDHLLATRMFRAGKIAARYDRTAEDLKKIEDALLKTWKQNKLAGEPERCMDRIRKDRLRYGAE